MQVSEEQMNNDDPPGRAINFHLSWFFLVFFLEVGVGVGGGFVSNFSLSRGFSIFST